MVKCEWYQALWGLSEPFEEQFKQIKEEGYVGVEGNLEDITDLDELRRLLKKYDLKFAPLAKTSGPDHFESFKRNCELAISFNSTYMNSHTGRDTMSIEEQDELFARILEYEKTLPMPVYHETHRSRPMFAPFTTLRLVEKFPEIKLTADFSHWCNVCESLLEDQQETMAKIIPHVGHVHARVGYDEGPQAPDPAAPEYRNALLAHEAWWREVARLFDGKTLTVVPEYGPAGYLHTLPYTNQPVADMLTVRRWARERFEKMVEDI